LKKKSAQNFISYLKSIQDESLTTSIFQEGFMFYWFWRCVGCKQIGKRLKFRRTVEKRTGCYNFALPISMAYYLIFCKGEMLPSVATH